MRWLEYTRVEEMNTHYQMRHLALVLDIWVNLGGNKMALLCIFPENALAKKELTIQLSYLMQVQSCLGIGKLNSNFSGTIF